MAQAKQAPAGLLKQIRRIGRIGRIRLIRPLIHLLALLAVWPMAASASPGDGPVLLISLDTARADHFSCYGYPRQTTPFLDEWAHETVLFENAISEEPWTLPAHSTMLTGLHPSRHGVNASSTLSNDFVSIAEQFHAQGRATGAFMGSALWFYPWRNLNQGFDNYDCGDGYRDVFSSLGLVNHWLDTHSGPGLFLFFHIMDLHARAQTPGGRLDYQPPAPQWRHFSKNPGSQSRKAKTARYDDSLRAVDTALKELFERLRRENRYDEALIIVTADHGEELGDRGRFGHWTVFEECARIPLLVKFPHGQRAGTRYAGLVQLADLYPTMCAAAGIPVPEGLNGVNLADLLSGTAPPRKHARIQRGPQTCIRGTRWKYVVDETRRKPLLFDLCAGPLERKNRYSTRHPQITELQQAHARFFFRHSDAVPLSAPPAPEASAEQRQLMESLGYLNP